MILFFVYHVNSIGKELDFRTDDHGFKPRTGMTRHINCVLLIRMSI